MIKQRLQALETLLRWVNNNITIANVLTKGLIRGFVALQQGLLTCGLYTVRGSEEHLQEKAKERERRTALRTTTVTMAATNTTTTMRVGLTPLILMLTLSIDRYFYK